MAAFEKWTARRGPTQQVDANGKTSWTAEIVYQVTDAEDERAAVAQCPLDKGSDHPVYGNELKVNLIDPNRSGANQFYEVRFGFSSAAPNTGGQVNTKAKINWGHDIVVEQVDRDFDGHPLLTSAGNASTAPLTDEFVDIVLSYTRWEPGFNVRKSVTFLNSVNFDDFVIRFGKGPFNGSGPGFGGGADAEPLLIYSGEMKCTGFRPVGEYEEDQSLVQVYYEFRIRERIQISERLFASGWDWRFLDQDTRGLYENSSGGLSIGDFWTARGNPVSEPVRLDGYGVPVADDTITIEGADTPFASSTPPAGAVLDERYKNSDPKAVFLIYKKRKRNKFRGLLPIFR